MITHVPAPSLQSLVELHGGYDRIPASAWQRFDDAMARWRDRQRTGADYEVGQNIVQNRQLRRRG
jgi:hypothetical protein